MLARVYRASAFRVPSDDAEGRISLSFRASRPIPALYILTPACVIVATRDENGHMVKHFLG